MPVRGSTSNRETSLVSLQCTPVVNDRRTGRSPYQTIIAGAGIEQNAPQALIYGWVLQFAYALVPYLFARSFQPDRPARLWGNWFSVITVNLGGLFLWVSIFAVDTQAVLHGIAYALWVVSMLPIVLELWHIVRDGLGRFEQADAAD